MARFTSMGDSSRRQGVWIAIVLVVVLAIVTRLIWVQIFDTEARAQAAEDARSHQTTLTATRGDIYDANGLLLATDLETYTIAINQRQVADFRLKDEEGTIIGWGASAAAELLAPILERNKNELGAELLGDNGWHVLARHVTPEVRQEILKLRINGIQTERTTQRVYPNGTTAGSILGWVNNNGDGAAGLEQSLDARLTGTDGISVVEIGAAGQVIPTGSNEIKSAIPGCDVRLTLDADLQYFAQTQADEALLQHGAERVGIVAIDIASNSILAMADSHALDPNDPTASSEADRGSWITTGSFDPGSTGKVLTFVSALEEGLITPTDVVANPYSLTTSNGQTFSDNDRHTDQQLTVAGALAQSANTSTVLIGDKMSDETRYNYMRAFGWGEPTGIGLPAESGGMLAHYENWDGRQRYTTMFGQGLTTSLLQNTQVFSIIGNGGIKNDLKLIDSYDCNGEIITPELSEPTQVVSQEAAEQTITMMESVVEDGTGVLARVPGYRVAGKTGTAQIPDGRGGLNERASSFVGVFPADDPQIAIGVVVYKPASTTAYGSITAAPVFSNIAQFAANSLNIAPSGEPATLYPLTPEN